MKNSIRQLAFGLPLFLAVYAACISSAKSEVTGWVKPGEIEVLSRRLSKEKLIPSKMECRGDSSSASVRDSIEIRMTYGPNTANKRWRWGWGIGFSTVKKYLERTGWSQISDSWYTRPKTGLLIRCGIFYKDRT